MEPRGAEAYSGRVPIRVALVNDYEVVVHGIASMLRSHVHRIEVVELNASSSVAEPVDIALFDTFTQSRDDGTGIVHLLENPRVDKVVVYTWSTDRALRDASLRLGVSGYLSKRMSASDLVTALDMVHKGEVVVSEEPDRLPLIGGDWPGREEGLTARESEVLCLITQGLTNAQIVERTPPLDQLDQVLHPLVLPQDQRRQPLACGPLGRRPRHAARPGPGPGPRHPRRQVGLTDARAVTARTGRCTRRSREAPARRRPRSPGCRRSKSPWPPVAR